VPDVNKKPMITQSRASYGSAVICICIFLL